MLSIKSSINAESCIGMGGTFQRCPSRLKSCRCRTATLERKSYRAAMVYKKILPRRCRDAAATRWLINLPLPRWFSKKCSKFHCHDCIGPEILVLDHQIRSVSECFTCKYYNSIKFMHFFNVLEKNAAATAPNHHRSSAAIDISESFCTL
jgi:hypothetical protein